MFLEINSKVSACSDTESISPSEGVEKFMAYRVDKKALLSAARHLGRFGDTDVFPHLPELTFLSDNEDEVVDELATLDLDTYEPSSSFEALAPKSRYGFRIVHQLPFVDTILLLASVVEIGEKIEAGLPHRSGPPDLLARRFPRSGVHAATSPQ